MVFCGACAVCAQKRCQQPRQFTGKIALGGRGAHRADL